MATTAIAVATVAACTSSGPGAGGQSSVDGANSTRTTTTAGATSPADASSTGAISFPVGVSADGRYLLDQRGAPYLLIGDSPQCLSANVSTADMEVFFADRQARGFNAAWVMLICGSYTHGRRNAATYDGVAPFLKDGDLSTPNPAYFERMDTMVHLAAQHGITLLLEPAETGSFRDLLKDNGVDKSREYGRWVGARYRNDQNIIWMLGNDYQTDQWKPYDAFELALAQGLRDSDPHKLQLVELNPPASTSFDDAAWPALMDVATAYSYTPTYDVVLRAYDSSPTQPVIMIEANYEDENNDGGPKTIDATLRRQEWWSALSGASGQLYGNGHTWGMNEKDWRKYLDTPAVAQLGVLQKFLGSRSWYQLVPDQAHTFLVGGLGKYSAQGDVLENDFATAALNPDGTLALVYTPTARTLTIDQSKLRSGTTAHWLDPTNGSFRLASPPFATPGKNAAGADDWVLVMEAPAR